ncbi:hypothetical protein ACFXP3_21335 [Streptomyces sp. NPDC059096]|uniref:hypothetical protein n=1 Tax=unclassified Streptomyces TaxID=2593676 RepID=UPI0036C733DE
MPEIEQMKDDVLNRVPTEFRPLLNLELLSAWTLDRQREHNEDLSMYEAGHAAFQVALRSQHVHGDGRFAARWRARKVNKHWKALVRASRNAAHASESLRTSYADHVRTVAALPAQREQKAVEKAERRRRGSDFAAKSLHKTAAAMAPRPAEGESPASETAGQAPSAPVRGIGDLFKKGA